MAITRVLYIVFPIKAESWFRTKTRCLVLSLIPISVGLLYAAPSLHSCCYLYYIFASYSISYVGPKHEVCP